jgi:predicted SpoU family rRNA methylase
LIDLQYFVEKLKATGHKVLILMDANQAEEQTYQPQSHNIKLVTKKGFNVDGTIGVFLQRFIQNCGLMNILRQTHEGAVPNTHSRGSVQIDFPLISSGLAEHVLGVGLLNRSVLQSDH